MDACVPRVRGTPLTETQATTYTFTGTLGVAYTFRVRATDNMRTTVRRNASDWAQAAARMVVVKKYYSAAGQRIASLTLFPEGV